MTVDHHDLAHEFPEHKERIHQLKMDDAHFAKLFDAYHDINNEIEVLENNEVPTSDERFEALKKQRLALKDELYGMLTA
ncbi:MAG: YdcH family protein [Pseudomonadota bacterium]